MMGYIGLFLICLIGCYLYVICFFSNIYLAIVVTALILAGFLYSYLNQSEKLTKMEKRIQTLEAGREPESSIPEVQEAQKEYETK